MASTKAEKEASIRWQKKNYSRIPLDVPPDEHARLKEIAKAAGKTLGGWIKEAIAEKIERDGIRSAPQETETAEEPEARAIKAEIERIRAAQEAEEITDQEADEAETEKVSALQELVYKLWDKGESIGCGDWGLVQVEEDDEKPSRPCKW